MAGETSIKLVRTPQQLQGAVSLPISKSLSNRALVLEYLTGKRLLGSKVSKAHDSGLLQSLLHSMDQTNALDVEDAGTVARFLLALCATRKGQAYTFTGTQRMYERPISGLAKALEQMGAQITYLGANGCLPLEIKAPFELRSEVLVGTHISSQFLSALLLMSPVMNLPFTIKTEGAMVSRPYVSMTCGILEIYGYTVEVKGNTYVVTKATKSSTLAEENLWESDWSAAIYPLLINGLHNQSTLTINNLLSTSLQGDSKVTGLLKSLGLNLEYSQDAVSASSTDKMSTFIEMNLEDSPDLAQPIIAYLAAKNQPAHITGLVTLQHKETNRLQAMATELNKLGARTSYTENSFSLERGIGKNVSAQIDTYNDHRMAMSFFLLQLVNPEIVIKNPEVVKKSFPSFWQVLGSLGFKFETSHDAV